MRVVHVQLVPVESGAAEDPLLLAQLNDSDRAAISALGFAADRDRAATARAAVRLELGRRLGMRPRLVPLLASQCGPPAVRGTSIGISWSHSGDWVALALSSTHAVGVDLELVPARVPLKALARIGVSSLEEFVTLEAAGKVSGDGLAAAWPSAVTARSFPAPAGYLGAVATSGDDWCVEMEPWGEEPPVSASATAIGLWDVTGVGSRKLTYADVRT